MPKNSSTASLASVVQKWLPRLRNLALAVETYGRTEHAKALHALIGELDNALPADPKLQIVPTAFVVKETFKVSRMQVAALLPLALGDDSHFRVTMRLPPEKFRFRSRKDEQRNGLDYPLNEGGSVEIATAARPSEVFRLDLESIREGLNLMAAKYPRHFSDLVNDSADSITANALLECCLFGGLINS